MLPGFPEKACGFRGPQRRQERRVQELTLLAESHRTFAGGPSQPITTLQAPSGLHFRSPGPRPAGEEPTGWDEFLSVNAERIP